jgi:hypothetical protein
MPFGWPFTFGTDRDEPRLVGTGHPRRDRKKIKAGRKAARRARR